MFGGILNSNAWDWVLIFIILTLAIAFGVKDGEKTAIPKELTVYAITVFTIILLLFNFGKVISFFTG